MRRQLAARLLQSLIVVLVVTTISFVVIRLAPGDPFTYNDPKMSLALRDHLRHVYGVDRPIGEQYLRYVTSIARGELGNSSSKHAPVADVLAQAIPRTLLLAGVALTLSFVLGGFLGVLQATHRGSWFDRLSSGILLLFYSLPDFWGALVMLVAFTYWWQLFPPGGMVDTASHEYMGVWRAIGDRINHLVLPVASLTLLTTAGIARHQRSAMLEVLPSEYIRTARAKGLPERDVIWRHAMRTAITPMIVLLGLNLPAFLGGAVFVETVFAWPGVGLLATEAVAARDYDLVCATVLIGSIMVIVGNLIADLLHMAVDPRVRE